MGSREAIIGRKIFVILCRAVCVVCGGVHVALESKHKSSDLDQLESRAFN